MPDFPQDSYQFARVCNCRKKVPVDGQYDSVLPAVRKESGDLLKILSA